MRDISDVKMQKFAYTQIRFLLVSGTVVPQLLELWINRNFVKPNEIQYQV
jgi:hypothetical protein